jgi:peptidyl-prolyl cis-trans isomerase A (cyclophilin A)
MTHRIKRISTILFLTAVFACDSQEGNAEPKPKAAATNSAALKDPAKANEQAPAKFTVKLQTTAGDILIDVDRSWAPVGADRIYNLVKAGYYDDVAFFRVISGFMAQVGIHGDPEVNKVWRNARIQDDPVKQSNTRGMVSFATAGPNTRTTQFFINFGNNARLDGMGFAPFGKVRNMEVVDKLHSGYGEGAPNGKGPEQGRIQGEGNKYLKADFPNLSWIKKATIEK